jgi:putative oxidoreductase
VSAKDLIARWADFVGRLILGGTFIYWGQRKLVDVLGFGLDNRGGWTEYMEARGVAGELLPLVIATELGCGLLLAVGFRTREAAIALAGFCVLANWFFHTDFSTPPSSHFNWVIFLKNLALAGALLSIAARGAGLLSIDARRDRPQP